MTSAVPDIEQRRRELMRRDRPLYDYIAARETAKALDSLGDTLSGRDHGAANLVWTAAAEKLAEAEALFDIDPGKEVGDVL